MKCIGFFGLRCEEQQSATEHTMSNPVDSLFAFESSMTLTIDLLFFGRLASFTLIIPSMLCFKQYILGFPA
jgi:hypothetical protein